MAQNSVFQRLAEIADVSSMTKEERLKYDEGLRKYRDTLCVMDGVRLKGLEEGLAKGRAEGLTEGIAKGLTQKSIEFARMMLQDGDSLEKIMRYTGLSAEEIEGL